MLLFGDAHNPSNGFYERIGAERSTLPTATSERPPSRSPPARVHKSLCFTPHNKLSTRFPAATAPATTATIDSLFTSPP